MKFYTALFVVLSGTWASAAETQVQSYSVKPAHRLVVADTPKGAGSISRDQTTILHLSNNTTSLLC